MSNINSQAIASRLNALVKQRAELIETANELGKNINEATAQFNEYRGQLVALNGRIEELTALSAGTPQPDTPQTPTPQRDEAQLVAAPTRVTRELRAKPAPTPNLEEQAQRTAAPQVSTTPPETDQVAEALETLRRNGVVINREQPTQSDRMSADAFREQLADEIGPDFEEDLEGAAEPVDLPVSQSASPIGLRDSSQKIIMKD